MEKRVDREWLSAAECALRTGLTVRALRVYERAGLINPARSAKGWRRYGPSDLARLNVIVILKALGLTLLQIREVITESAPSLVRILQVQAESLRAKGAALGRALAFVEAAQNRLQSQQSLSIDELCDLIKRLATKRSAEMKSPVALMRELINEHITPEEERAWHTWWAQHPQDLAANLEFVKSQNELFIRLQHLVEQGADPSSAEVQQLMQEHCDVLGRYGVRERAVRHLEWNPTVTFKWYSLGTRARERQLSNSTAPGAVVILDRRCADFFLAALKQSPLGRSLGEIVDGATRLLEKGGEPGSPDRELLLNRYRDVCHEHGLGQPTVFAHWTVFISRVNRGEPSGEERERVAAWEFLARAAADS